MTQVFVMGPIRNLDRRDYSPGVVVNFPNDVAVWLRSRGLVDDSATAVAAAIAAGAVQLVHSTGPADNLPEDRLGDCRQLVTDWAATSSNNIATTSYERVREVDFPFTGFRAVAYNTGAPPVGDVLQCAVGVAADTATAASGLVTVTWGDSKAVSPTSLFTKTTLAGETQIVLSNPGSLESIPRTDGGSGFLSVRRALVNGAVQYSQHPGVTAGIQYQQVARTNFTRQANGDFVTANQAGFLAASTSPAGGNLTLFDVILFGSGGVRSVAHGGNSLARGQYGDYGGDNHAALACRQLTLDGEANISYGHGSVPASTATVPAFRAVEYIERIRPEVFIWQHVNCNNAAPSTAGQISKERYYTELVVDAARRMGTRLILETTPVWQLWGAASHAAVVAEIYWLSDLARACGAEFFDLYSLTGNGANPPQLTAGYGYPTGVAGVQAHLAAPAYRALAVPYAAVLRRALRI